MSDELQAAIALGAFGLMLLVIWDESKSWRVIVALTLLNFAPWVIAKVFG